MQCYKQTYKVLKSNKHVWRALLLQGEKAASNVIKPSLILENGLSWSLSLVMHCVLWVFHMNQVSGKDTDEYSHNKIFKEKW